MVISAEFTWSADVSDTLQISDSARIANQLSDIPAIPAGPRQRDPRRDRRRQLRDRRQAEHGPRRDRLAAPGAAGGTHVARRPR
jgi:hypothetical protein